MAVLRVRRRRPARLVVRSPVAVRRVLSSPGEIGFARAYVAGDIDVMGTSICLAAHAGRWMMPSAHRGRGSLLPVRLVGPVVSGADPSLPLGDRLPGLRHSVPGTPQRLHTTTTSVSTGLMSQGAVRMSPGRKGAAFHSGG